MAGGENSGTGPEQSKVVLGGGNAADKIRLGPDGLPVVANGKNTSSGSSSNRGLSITPKTTAYSQIDSEFIKLFGHRASEKQKAEYFRALNRQEKEFATISGGRSGGQTTYDAAGNATSVSTDSGSSTNYAFDPSLFLQDYVIAYASSEIKAGKPLGGVVGQNYATVAQYASDMGISTNPSSLLKDTINVATGKTDIVSLQNSYRDRAAIKWAPYADLIKNNPSKSLRDLTQDQLDTVAQMLDLNINDLSFNDSTVNKILSATNKDGKGYIMNNAEIQSFVRKNDSRFPYSTVAHKEAVDLANSFASSFGFGA